MPLPVAAGGLRCAHDLGCPAPRVPTCLPCVRHIHRRPPRSRLASAADHALIPTPPCARSAAAGQFCELWEAVGRLSLQPEVALAEMLGFYQAAGEGGWLPRWWDRRGAFRAASADARAARSGGRACAPLAAPALPRGQGASGLPGALPALPSSPLTSPATPPPQARWPACCKRRVWWRAAGRWTRISRPLWARLWPTTACCRRRRCQAQQLSSRVARAAAWTGSWRRRQWQRRRSPVRKLPPASEALRCQPRRQCRKRGDSQCQRCVAADSVKRRSKHPSQQQQGVRPACKSAGKAAVGPAPPACRPPPASPLPAWSSVARNYSH